MPRRVSGCARGGVPLMYVSRRTGTGLGRGRARQGRSEAHEAGARTGREGGCTTHPRHLVIIYYHINIIASILLSNLTNYLSNNLTFVYCTTSGKLWIIQMKYMNKLFHSLV